MQISSVRQVLGCATLSRHLTSLLVALVSLTLTAHAAPVISGFTPMYGPVGTTVNLVGTDLGGVTSVQFGPVAVPNFVVNAAGTQITTTVPQGATTGHIYVLSPSGNAASPSNFTVTDPLPTLSPSVPTAHTEGSAAAPGNVVFTVSLSAPTTAQVTVNYQTTDNTALAGTDYVAKTGTLTFAPGEISKTVTVTFVGDAIAENSERFFFDLKTPVNATLATSRTSSYIRDDDGPQIYIDDAKAVLEGNPPSAGAPGTTPQVFNVRLSAASTDTVTVNWATANNTAGPADYTVANGTLTFAPGETLKTITILVKGDTTVEPTETYRVKLASPKFAIIGDSTGIGYIKNDDVTTVSAQKAKAPSE